MLGLFLQTLSGELILESVPVLLYHAWREENYLIRQDFPHRTVTILSTSISIEVSWLLDLMSDHQLFPESWDFLQVFKKDNIVEKVDGPNPFEKMNQVCN